MAASCCGVCFAAGGTGELHKIDGIMRQENYVNILKQQLKTSVRKLKLGRILPKLRQNVLRKTKSRYWSGHHKALTSILNPKFVGRTEKECVSKETYKPGSVIPALSGGMGQNAPNFLWEACGRLPKTFDPS